MADGDAVLGDEQVITVALVGPDGAGKTTVARALTAALPIPAEYLYMGVNLEASGRLLPTTRLARAVKRALGQPTSGPPPLPDAGGRTSAARGPGASAYQALKAPLRLASWLAEEWYRQVVAWGHLRRGRVVIFDRHFYADFYTRDIAGHGGRSVVRRLHGWLLERWYPRPDLTLYLDAPAEVLFGRKGEGTVEWLEQRRRDYLALALVMPRFAVVDVSQPIEEATRTAAELILDCYRARAGAGLPEAA